MALETVDVMRRPREKQRTGLLSGLPEGLIAGAGFGSVFGGPVGALIGAGVGVLAKRLHQSQLDTAAQEADTAYSLNVELEDSLAKASQLPGLSDVDREQLAAIDSQRRKFSILSNDADPDVRANARRGLAELSTNPWLEDVETRTEKLEDAVRSDRKAHGDNQVQAFNKYRDQADRAQTEANAILKLANELGSDNPGVQARYKNFIGGSAAGEELAIHIKALGLDPGDRVASGDEIVKGTTAVTSAVTDISRQRQAAILDDLKKRGYLLNTGEDGSLTIDTAPAPDITPRPEAQREGREPSAVGALGRGVKQAGTDILDMIGGAGTAEELGSDAADMAADLRDWWQSRLEENRQFHERARQERKRREVNR